jgi:hypothetical protein
MDKLRHSRRTAAITVLCSLALCATAAAEPVDTGFIFETFGPEQCEALPADMPPAQAEAALGDPGRIEAARAAGEPVLEATMTGFMAGPRLGVTVFGTHAQDSGLGAVASVWGPLPSGQYATLCLALVQIGAVPVVPGEYPVVGVAGLESAASGDMLVAAAVMVLEPTGRQSEAGRDIYRLARIGEGFVTGGNVRLERYAGSTFGAALRIEGTMRLDTDREARAFTLEGSTEAVRNLRRVPTLTATD